MMMIMVTMIVKPPLSIDNRHRLSGHDDDGDEDGHDDDDYEGGGVDDECEPPSVY